MKRVYEFTVMRRGFHNYVRTGFGSRAEAGRAMRSYIIRHPTGNLGSRSKGRVTIDTGARKRKARGDVFEQAQFTMVDYQTVTLVLGVIVVTSGDAATKLKCHKALKGLRRLRKLVKGKSK